MFLISQSLLDSTVSILLIATAWDVVYGNQPGHRGIGGEHETETLQACRKIFCLLFNDI